MVPSLTVSWYTKSTCCIPLGRSGAVNVGLEELLSDNGAVVSPG